MTNFITTRRCISYFIPPIAPVRDEHGRITTPATLTPCCNVSIEQIYRMVAGNEKLKAITERVRSADDLRAAKASLLPYVTPCGIFTRRTGKHLLEPSGLTVIDIDHLGSCSEAGEMREELFNDPFLCPVLAFVSPGGRGVKAFVPYTPQPPATDATDAHPETPAADALHIARSTECIMNYVSLTYGSPTDKGVDTSGKDIVRACFLSYDSEARVQK